MSNSRAARRRLARHDGKTVTVTACCRLAVQISPTRIRARHDDDCPALDPSTPAGLVARVLANQAVSRVMGDHGANTVVVMT